MGKELHRGRVHTGFTCDTALKSYIPTELLWEAILALKNEMKIDEFLALYADIGIDAAYVECRFVNTVPFKYITDDRWWWIKSDCTFQSYIDVTNPDEFIEPDPEKTGYWRCKSASCNRSYSKSLIHANIVHLNA